MRVNNKKELAIVLSQLDKVNKPKIWLEQYSTDSEIAATILWDAFMKGHIKEKTIADFGCGNGILGIGALLLDAKKVYFIDKDADSLNVLKKNLALLNLENFEIIHSDIKDVSVKVDTVLQNPPFGTRNKHADKEFLIKAFESSNVVYSFHKTSTRQFVESISKDFGFRIINEFKFKFPLKQEYAHHEKRIERIDVSCFYLIKA